MTEGYVKGYLEYLSSAKTEREAVLASVKLAEANGFTEFDPGKQYQPGDRIYKVIRKKSALLSVIGRKPLEEGVSVILAHIDSPRLDLKPSPFYQRGGQYYFDTHYYGGIKKYQWATIPLALHGRILKKDGTEVLIRIGENPEDPVFTITDLPPHVSARQLEKKAGDFIGGEGLDALIGSAENSEGSNPSEKFLRLLEERYAITAEDFISSELHFVPAAEPRFVGFDESLIGGYGQDDKVCAYPALQALFAQEKPEYTALVILADKEETGSNGTTGVQTPYYKDFLEDLAESQGGKIRRVLEKSLCISADVITTYNPLYPEENEERNMARLGKGVVLSKYRGFKGKADTQDATAEFVSLVHKLFDEHQIPWQSGEAGKVDAGGGKTAGRFIATYNFDTLDVGVPILSMHSPFETVAVRDLYAAADAYAAFLGRTEYRG